MRDAIELYYNQKPAMLAYDTPLFFVYSQKVIPFQF